MAEGLQGRRTPHARPCAKKNCQYVEAYERPNKLRQARTVRRFACAALLGMSEYGSPCSIYKQPRDQEMLAVAGIEGFPRQHGREEVGGNLEAADPGDVALGVSRQLITTPVGQQNAEAVGIALKEKTSDQ